MKILKHYSAELITLLLFVIAGQIIFGLFSSRYTTSYYENRVFATTGIQFDGKGDLHLLNEGAHYFGQTMIGWTKFPSFHQNLIQSAQLPEDTALNMRMQERQNIILTLTTREPIKPDQLENAKNFLQERLDEYNQDTNTTFILTNVDYEQAEIKRSYTFGAAFALILSLALCGGFLFLKREFFPPRLKL